MTAWLKVGCTVHRAKCFKLHLTLWLKISTLRLLAEIKGPFLSSASEKCQFHPSISACIRLVMRPTQGNSGDVTWAVREKRGHPLADLWRRIDKVESNVMACVKTLAFKSNKSNETWKRRKKKTWDKIWRHRRGMSFSRKWRLIVTLPPKGGPKLKLIALPLRWMAGDNRQTRGWSHVITTLWRRAGRESAWFVLTAGRIFGC